MQKLPIATTKAPDRTQVLENIPQELIDALIEFISQRLSGRIEIHFSNGGIAKIIGMPTKVYK